MFDPDERPAVDLSSAGAATVVADVVITSRPTALLVEATRRGLTTVHGNEMLVRQAAIGFELWTGREAPLPVLRAALAAALGLSSPTGIRPSGRHQSRTPRPSRRS